MGKELKYFKAALDGYLNEKGKSQNWLALNSGITQQTINNLCKGSFGKEITRDKLFDFIGTDFLSFLEYGKKIYEKDASTIEGLPLNSKPHVLIIQTHSEADKEYIDTEHYIPVPLYEKGKIAAFSGGSAFDPFETPERHVMIYSPSLNHRTKHRLVAGKVGGDSMNPLIPEGSIIVVDLDDREYLKDKIYLVSDDDDIEFHMAVKKVRKFKKENGFLLLSENTEYDPRLVVESDWLRLCVGRVVWMWRSFDNDF